MGAEIPILQAMLLITCWTGSNRLPYLACAQTDAQWYCLHSSDQNSATEILGSVVSVEFAGVLHNQ